MTKSTRTAKIVIILAVMLCICVAVVTVGTLSALRDSKSATGSVTFNLADYDLYVQQSAPVEGVIAPGKTGYTNTMKVVNSYKTTDGTLYGTPTDNGAIVAMDAVYIKLTITSIAVGDTTLTVSTYSYADGYLTIASSNGLEIKLDANAGTGLYWYTSNNNIYLMNGTSSSATQTTLAFSSSAESETSASVRFAVSIAESGVNNGFNGSGSNSNQVNQYQGEDVVINYTVSWGTTLENLEAVTIA